MPVYIQDRLMHWKNKFRKESITLSIQNAIQETKSVESEAQVIALKKASLAYVNLP